MPYDDLPHFRLLGELGDLLADAAHAAYEQHQRRQRRHRIRTGAARHPGADSPMWNVVVSLLRQTMVQAPRGTRARLARYLGLPRQRITDFLSGKRRLPDAEITLRLLHWLAETRAGRDPSV